MRVNLQSILKYGIEIVSNMSEAADELLLKICKCPNLHNSRDNTNHACNEIVNLQDITSDDFQLPEPWSGDIVNAPLLCIASNPSINHEEKYPNSSWNDEEIIDFFRNRFSVDSKWTSKRRVLLSDGETYTRTPVSYWSKVHAQAKRAFARDVRMGVDYAITEVVHCKSVKELNVDVCKKECWRLWMPQIINLSSASVLMLFGKHSTDWFEENHAHFHGKRIIEDLLVNGIPRTVVRLPHPTSWEKVKKMDELLTPLEMKIVQNRLKTD